MGEPLIGQGFSLVMQLRAPREMEPLLQALAKAREKINEALSTLDYVHSARFLPIVSHGLLLIVTEFDGVDKDYVMDFATLLDEEFSLILSYMKDAPPLPVSRYPNEFWEYVSRNSRSPFGKFPDVFMPYPDKAVIDIVGAKRAKKLPPARKRDVGVPLEYDDLQANIVDGFHGVESAHVRVRFSSAKDGQAFLAELLSDKAALRVTTGGRWNDKSDKPPYCLNIGFTHAGLAELGVAYDVLRRFPQAFVDGPLARAEKIVGDIGNNDPKNWQPPKTGPDGQPIDVHAMISLYARDRGGLGAYERLLDDLIVRHKVVKAFDEPLRGALLKKPDNVHFGYRDGLSLPKADPPGDFILGADRVNSRGATFIGSLPEALARNGTYGALRVVEQDTAEFEAFLKQVRDDHAKDDVDPEWIAAKLMGRWRDGSPLALHPDRSDPDIGSRKLRELDEFDYVASGRRRGGSSGDAGDASDDAVARPSVDDFEGLRCPVGAHIRRFNPRHGLVLGVPWGRRVLRRGMPYGKDVDPACPDDGEKRGLIGIFYCGDLESQYEFLLKVWANQDVSAAGLRGSQEPFVGSRPGKTPFVINRKDKDPIKLEVPVLTTCRGSLYMFVPGIRGLHWLAGDRKTTHAPSPPASKVVTWFDPADPSFHVDPYPFYAAFRKREGEGGYVARIGGLQQRYWVFGHELVRKVTDDDEVFQKPGKDRGKERRNASSVAAQFGDGLFFMDRPRHTQVRSLMDGALKPNVECKLIEPQSRRVADRLLGALAGRGTCELVAEYAAQLPKEIFMSVMGIPADDVQLVDLWVCAALKGHNPSASGADQGAGATASMALRSYFSGLQLEMAKRVEAGPPSVLEAMKKCTRPTVSDDAMSSFEAVNTAIQFALGGYLSTQFLIASGVYTLLRNPEQWEALRDDRSLLDQAVTEMLRYEAPFQIADRWVAKKTALNGFELEKDDKIAVVYGSANRDEIVFGKDADRFDIFRSPPEKDVFGFGNGIHRCIGAPLAPVVARVALEALLDHYPFARLGPAGPWSTDPYFRSLSQLTLLLR